MLNFHPPPSEKKNKKNKDKDDDDETGMGGDPEVKKNCCLQIIKGTNRN